MLARKETEFLTFKQGSKTYWCYDVVLCLLLMVSLLHHCLDKYGKTQEKCSLT